MTTNQKTGALNNLLKNPSEILGVIKNPGRYGMDIFNDLTTKQKQYVLYAAGAGLIMYGIYLGRGKKTATRA
ncbi:hypothetical protein OB13_14145 [Pontibacter sp. HJ8]